MTDYPIIFSAPMVKALLDGRKQMTRRLAWKTVARGPHPDGALCYTNWNKVQPGDRLWVRENFTIVPSSAYRRSDGVQQTICPSDPDKAAIYAEGWDRSIPKWRPSIHMPRWASRLTLVVTATKIERLQDISGTDAIAEGLADLKRDGENWHWDPNAAYGAGHFAPWRAFRALWISLHGQDGWDANPEVVCLSFAVHKTNIDQMKDAA